MATKILYHFNNSFVDASGNSFDLPTGGTFNSSGKFSQGFNLDVSKGITIPDSIFANGEFTVEFFLKFTSVSGSTEDIVILTANGQTRMRVSSGTGGSNLNLNTLNNGSSFSISDANWHHYAITFNGSSYAVYQDGVQKMFFNDNAAYTGTIQLTFAQSPYTPDGNAIIDEFRLSDTVVYLTNNFTPPTQEFTSQQGGNMAQQITKKFLGPDSVDGTKIKLLKDQILRGVNQADQDVDLLKLDSNDKLLVMGSEVATKAMVDQEVSDRVAAVSAAITTAEGYTDTAISNLINGAGSALDTLKELADALGNDANFSTTITNMIGAIDGRVTVVEGDIVTIQGDISTLQGQVAALEASQEILEFADYASFPVSGVVAKIYVDKALNNIWRWNGSAYEELASTASVESDIVTLQGRATALEGDVATLQGEMATAQADIIAAQADIDNHIANTTDAHDATAISFVDNGNFTGVTDVQGAIYAIDAYITAHVIQDDGSVAMTADLNLASHKITNLAAATTGTDAATLAQVNAMGGFANYNNSTAAVVLTSSTAKKIRVSGTSVPSSITLPALSTLPNGIIYTIINDTTSPGYDVTVVLDAADGGTSFTVKVGYKWEFIAHVGAPAWRIVKTPVLLTSGMHFNANISVDGNYVQGLNLIPVNDSDAAPKKYVDDSITALGISGYLKKDGSVAMTGNLNLGQLTAGLFSSLTFSYSDGLSDYYDLVMSAPAVADYEIVKVSGNDAEYSAVSQTPAGYLNAGTTSTQVAQEPANPDYTFYAIRTSDNAIFKLATTTIGSASLYPYPPNFDGSNTYHKIINLGDPTLARDAANKQYVDDSITALGISGYLKKDGSVAMTGALDLGTHLINNVVDPVSVQDAATKNYVDVQDALKLSLSGGTMSGVINMGGQKIISLGTPDNATDAATKGYVDSFVGAGIVWLHPILDPNLRDDSLSAPPVSPNNFDAYIVGSSASGAWAGKEGHAMFYNGSAWIDLLGRAVAIGDRFGVMMYGGASAGGIASKEKQIAQITDATVGAIVYSFTVPSNNQAVYINAELSHHFGHSYNYDGTNWIEFAGPSSIADGVGLTWDGNTLNVNLGAGIQELPTDEIGIDIHASGALMLTVDGSSPSSDSASQLSVKLDGSTLSRSSAGLRVAASGIDDSHIAALAGIALNKLAALAPDSVVITDTNGYMTQSNVTATELGYVGGVTSNIQTQLDTKVSITDFKADGGVQTLTADGTPKLANATKIIFNSGTTATTLKITDDVANNEIGTMGTIYNQTSVVITVTDGNNTTITTIPPRHEMQVVLVNKSPETWLYNAKMLRYADGYNAAGRKLVNLLDPTADQDAATKIYVDTAVAAVNQAFEKETIVLVAGDITNGYVDLAFEALPKSVVAFVGRLGMHEDYDYLVSVVSGKTRITFKNSTTLIGDGVEAPVAGDTFFFTYAK